MPRHCFALDLKNDPALIDEYIEHHRNVWPEVIASFHEAGVRTVELYRIGTRLVMLFETDDTYSAERKAQIDAHPRIQQWEQLMSKYQQPLPEAAPGQKWVEMDCIFDFHSDRAPQPAAQG